MPEDEYDLFNPPPEPDPSLSQERAPDLSARVSVTDEEKVERQRERLFAKVRSSREMTTIEARVANILSHYPETRNSDITLQLQYWTLYQRDLLDGDMPSPEQYYLAEKLSSIERARRVVQNDLKLFPATDGRVARKRQQLAQEFRVGYAPPDVSIPNVFVYGDESGKNKANLVVGSVWMLATGEYTSFRAEIMRWKEANGVKHEMHSARIGKPVLATYKDFVERFMVDRGLLGFKAITVPNSGFSDEGPVFEDLYYWLIRRGVEHEHDTGRAPLPRLITFTKDAEERGYDERLLTGLDIRVRQDAKTTFQDRLYFLAEEPIDSKAEVLVQIADLFTWCVNRQVNRGPSDELNFRDEFADWALAALGFTLEVDDVVGDRAVRLHLRSPTIAATATRTFLTPEAELEQLDGTDTAGDDQTASVESPI